MTRICLLVTLALSPIGCSHMNNMEKDAAVGGAIGAGAGTLIGAATGNPKTGAVVGGLIGAGTGAAIGNAEDHREARDAKIAQAQAYAEAQPNRINEVIELVRNGHGDQVIINHIRDHRMYFNLSVADLNTLKANNVPDRVIAEMQNSRPVVRRPVVARERVYVREPVYVDPFYGPPPMAVIVAPPPPVFGVGFQYRR